MSNIATTIEQSKHLLELGLDPKTADMYWIHVKSQTKDFWKLEVIQRYWRPYEGVDSHLPAWSLSALLEVMPKGAELTKMQNDAHELYYEVDYMFTGYEDKDPVTSVYEMVCWLLENNLIKKGEQDE